MLEQNLVLFELHLANGCQVLLLLLRHGQFEAVHLQNNTVIGTGTKWVHLYLPAVDSPCLFINLRLTICGPILILYNLYQDDTCSDGVKCAEIFAILVPCLPST